MDQYGRFFDPSHSMLTCVLHEWDQEHGLDGQLTLFIIYFKISDDCHIFSEPQLLQLNIALQVLQLSGDGDFLLTGFIEHIPHQIGQHDQGRFQLPGPRAGEGDQVGQYIEQKMRIYLGPEEFELCHQLIRLYLLYLFFPPDIIQYHPVDNAGKQKRQRGEKCKPMGITILENGWKRYLNDRDLNEVYQTQDATDGEQIEPPASLVHISRIQEKSIQIKQDDAR
jgi:hypothetical protein